jgi:hypothetical protein
VVQRVSERGAGVRCACVRRCTFFRSSDSKAVAVAPAALPLDLLRVAATPVSGPLSSLRRAARAAEQAPADRGHIVRVLPCLGWPGVTLDQSMRGRVRGQQGRPAKAAVSCPLAMRRMQFFKNARLFMPGVLRRESDRVLEMQRNAVLNATVQAGAGRGQKGDADATRSGRAAEGQFVYDCRHSTFRFAADVARERQNKAERAERERAQLDPGASGTADARLRRDQVLYDSKTSSFYPRGGSPPAGTGSEGHEGGREEDDSVTAGRSDAERKRQDAKR